MSQYLRNLTDSPVYNVELTDLGITVEVGVDYDTSEIDSGDLGNSIDLVTAIQAGEVAFLNDETSPWVPLSSQESQAIINASNNAATNILGTENFFPKWADDCPCTLTESNMYQDPSTGYIGVNLQGSPLTPATDFDINGSLQLTGSSSGYTRFDVPASGDNVIYTLPSNDGDSSQVLQTDGSGTLTWVDQTVGTSVLNDLDDVTTSSPTSGEVLVYQGSPAEWQNNTLAEAGISAVGHSHSLGDLSDVNVTASGSPLPTDGQVLTYDTTNGWQPENPYGAGCGMVIQRLHGSVAEKSGTSEIPYDDTTPLVTEGTEVWSRAITPVNTANDIELTCSLTLDAYVSGGMGGGDMEVVVTFFRDSTCIGAMAQFISSYDEQQVHISLTDSPSTTSSITYSCRIGRLGSEGTWYVNRLSSSKFNGMLAKQGYILKEIDNA